MRNLEGARQLLNRRFLRFCLVGGAATFIHASVFLFAYAESASTIGANALGYISSLTFNVIANYVWTFGENLQADGSARKMVFQFLVTLSGFGLNTVIAVGMVDCLGASPIWAALVMATLTPITVYTLCARLIFSRQTIRVVDTQGAVHRVSDELHQNRYL